jgi:hypothetical protein
MENSDREVRYRIRGEAQPFKLTVYDAGADPEKEETLIEGLEFTNIEDVLHFIAVHYPNAKEDM